MVDKSKETTKDVKDRIDRQDKVAGKSSDNAGRKSKKQEVIGMVKFVIKDRTDSSSDPEDARFEDTRHSRETANEAHETLRELKEKGAVSEGGIVEMR